MEIERLLKKPPLSCKDLVLWCVNGRFDAIDIKRQFGVFQQMGFGGVCIKSGSGLKEDYNGEGWIEVLKVSVDQAKRLGMEVYLCDDDAQAFGTNGGLATMNPRFRAKSFVCKILHGADFSFADYKNEFVCAYGVRLTKEDGEQKLAYYYTINNSSEVRKGDDVMVITISENESEPRYNGSYAPDCMSADAFNYFLALRLAKYREIFHNEFGVTIKGIFTSDCMIDYSVKERNGNLTRPFSQALGSEFYHQNGYRLLPRLPEIFYAQAGEDYSVTAQHYCATVKKTFEKNRLNQYALWCKENGLVFMGALGYYDTPIDGVVGQDRMRVMDKFDVPAIYVQDGNTPVIKYAALASISNQNAKKAYSACFLNADAGSTFSQYKNELDFQAYFGIDRKIYCSAFSSIQENSKREGNSFSYQMPSYTEFKTLTDYSARLNVLNSHSTSIAPILVVYGEESVDGKFSSTYERESLEDLCSVLIEHDVGFDLACEEKLVNCAKEKGFGKKTRLVVGNSEYSTVIICGATTLRSSTIALLTKYGKRGGNCVFAGFLPTAIDGNETDYKKLPLYAYSKVRKIDATVLDGINLPLSMVVEDESGCISIRVRKSEYGYYLFAINKHKEGKTTARITVNGEFTPAKFNLINGEVYAIEHIIEEEKTSFAISIDANSSICLGLFKKELGELKKEVTAKMARDKVEPPSSLEYRLSEFNVLVLDVASVTVDGQSLGKAEILSCAEYLRSQYNLTQKGGIQPWFNERILKNDTKKSVAQIRLNYSFGVETKPLKLKLAMERPDAFEIYVNGRKLPMQKDGLFVDKEIEKIHVPSTYIHEGKNEITLLADLCDDLPLEPLYLLGNFGVRVNRNENDFDKYEITELPQRLTFGNICEQGLPFYGGKIYYYLPLKEGDYSFRFDKRNNWDYVKIRTKESSTKVAFSPFECRVHSSIAERDYERYESLGEVTIFEAPYVEGVQIEVALTRRNTFGPLHVSTKYKKQNGVYKKVTEFSRSALLIENGLGEIFIRKVQQ